MNEDEFDYVKNFRCVKCGRRLLVSHEDKERITKIVCYAAKHIIKLRKKR